MMNINGKSSSFESVFASRFNRSLIELCACVSSFCLLAIVFFCSNHSGSYLEILLQPTRLFVQTMRLRFACKYSILEVIWKFISISSCCRVVLYHTEYKLECMCSSFGWVQVKSPQRQVAEAPLTAPNLERAGMYNQIQSLSFLQQRWSNPSGKISSIINHCWIGSRFLTALVFGGGGTESESHIKDKGILAPKDGNSNQVVVGDTTVPYKHLAHTRANVNTTRTFWFAGKCSQTYISMIDLREYTSGWFLLWA